MTTTLPPESFVALAAVAWADGRMSKDEAAGLLTAAKRYGLDGDALSAVERATKEKVELESFDASSLSTWDRLLTYGFANWLSRLDGVQGGSEIASLRALARKLESAEVTDFKLRSAASTAFDVAVLPDGQRPERYDFAAFEAKLLVKFPKAK